MNSALRIIREVEKKYSIVLPIWFHQLAPDMEEWPFTVGTCQFNTPEDLLDGSERYAEMPAGLFPFGKENGSQFCFFFGKEGNAPDPPIVFHDADSHDVNPIATLPRGFLWYEFLIEEVGQMQYYTSDADTEKEKKESKEKISRIAELLNVPFTFGPKPYPEDEKDLWDFHTALLEVDPDAAQSLCWIGKSLLEQGNTDAAESYLTRSTRSAPYLAAPHYFLARAMEEKGESRRAQEWYWRVACCPMHTSGAARYDFDLGVLMHRYQPTKGYPEGHILGKTFTALQEKKPLLLEIAKGNPLGEYVLSSDPHDEYDRADLAEEYVRRGELISAAREWTNVLYITWGEKPRGDEAVGSLLRIYRELGWDWAVAMHSDARWF